MGVERWRPRRRLNVPLGISTGLGGGRILEEEIWMGRWERAVTTG
ncbi:MAG: hypothetical protein Q8P22_06935 [Chloroflexota bacterium]|nr:hypothetical protein [Chloroflexota bacterium]